MVEVDASLKYGMDYFGFIGVRKTHLCRAGLSAFFVFRSLSGFFLSVCGAIMS